MSQPFQGTQSLPHHGRSRSILTAVTKGNGLEACLTAVRAALLRQRAFHPITQENFRPVRPAIFLRSGSLAKAVDARRVRLWRPRIEAINPGGVISAQEILAMKKLTGNVFDIQCPQCKSGYDLYMLDRSDPTVRPGIRFVESEDGMSATQLADAGEWIPLGAYWAPEEMDKLTAFVISLGGALPLGVPVWCAACGHERPFEDFDGDLAVEARQFKAVLKVFGISFPPKK
jgi:hypothetical protein